MIRRLPLGIVILLLAAPILAQEPGTAVDAYQGIEAPRPQTSASRGKVHRAIFTSAVQEREPVDQIEALANDQGKIFFFTELRDFDGQTALHRWEYKGQVMAEVPFKVRGARWRVWSSKTLEPIWTGEWRVSVVDGNGRVVESRRFVFAEPWVIDRGGAKSPSPLSPTDAPQP